MRPGQVMSSGIRPRGVTPVGGADPVGHAVLNNVFNSLYNPRKPMEQFRCEVCSLDFTSQMIQEAHFYGSKHAKKVKSLEILQEMKKNEQGSIKLDDSNGIYRCVLCKMDFNSIQQLQAHLDGSKHIQMKTHGKILPSSPQEAGAGAENVANEASGEAAAKKIKVDTNGGSKEATPEACVISLPEGVVRVDTSGKAKKYKCTTCQVTVNSDTQLHQHLSSQKHQDKVAGKRHTWWKSGAHKANVSAPRLPSHQEQMFQKRQCPPYFSDGSDEYYGSYGYSPTSSDYMYERAPYSHNPRASGYNRPSHNMMGAYAMAPSSAGYVGMTRPGMRSNMQRVPRPEQTFVSAGIMKPS